MHAAVSKGAELHRSLRPRDQWGQGGVSERLSILINDTAVAASCCLPESGREKAFAGEDL